MKKKALVIIAIISLFAMTAMTSCSPEFSEGFRQGWNTTAPPEYRY